MTTSPEHLAAILETAVGMGAVRAMPTARAFVLRMAPISVVATLRASIAIAGDSQ